jgi:hypothetical protein
MTIRINGNDVEIAQPHLKRWIEQAKLQGEINKSAELHERDKTVEAIYKYLNFFSQQDWETFGWFEVLNVLSQITNLCVPKIDFPIFHTLEKTEQVIAEYSEKEWYFWLHTLCSKYHWAIEYVKELEIDDAFGLLQEGLIEKQQEREWQWSLTEIAYPYDESSKKSIFKPLKRPDWMTVVKDLTPKKIKIRKDMMPMGVIMNFEEMYAAPR